MGRTSVVMVEAISMSDKIIVLSKRPASVKSVHEINLVTEGEKTPLKLVRCHNSNTTLTFYGRSWILMKSNNNYSEGYANYLKNIKKEKVKVLLIQIALLVGILVLWEILANAGIIQTFLFSKPSDIYKLFIKYISNGELMKHVGISVYETVLGLVIGTVLGILVAIALWWSEKLSKILDPFLVVLNALPKTALAPIIIVWAGAGIQGIVVTAVTISVVVTILSAYNYFINVDEEK